MGRAAGICGRVRPGDFIYVPPFVPHQEINANPEEPLECVLVRSDNEAIVVNITDVDPVGTPEAIYWMNPIHKHRDDERG